MDEITKKYLAEIAAGARAMMANSDAEYRRWDMIAVAADHGELAQLVAVYNESRVQTIRSNPHHERMQVNAEQLIRLHGIDTTERDLDERRARETASIERLIDGKPTDEVMLMLADHRASCASDTCIPVLVMEAYIRGAAH